MSDSVRATAVATSAVPTPDEAMQSIADYVARIKAAFPARQFLGIGLAAPGLIDLTTSDSITIGRVPS